MIRYSTTVAGLDAHQLKGFFAGWSDPPSPATHLRILQNSSASVLAIDEETQQVIGFINAISDGILTAYIPLLEVLPEYQKQGVGQELVKRMLDQLKALYMVDLLCDADLQPFYQKLGMKPAIGMLVRHYENQSGRIDPDDH